MTDKGHQNEITSSKWSQNSQAYGSFVLEKDIFSNIFERDIKRVFIYKKAERLAKAIHLVSPAFKNSQALKDRLDRISVTLVDAGTLPIGQAKGDLSRELLALSSVLGIARASGLLTEMNADVITREAHNLLQEIASYEEPRLILDESPTLSELARESGARAVSKRPAEPLQKREQTMVTVPTPTLASEIALQLSKRQNDKGQAENIKDKPKKASRKQAIFDVLRSRGSLSIRDIASSVRDVSEKTIQRELQALVDEGTVSKKGERRWTVYSLT